MSDLPRRTIAELVARYDLEPKLCDVIVEGQFDREVISRSLLDAGQPPRIVYEVDTVDVPDDLVAQYGFTMGNKQRVIVLARELVRLPDTCAFRCLVDRDLDHWFGSMEQVKRLLWTDYCALELYFFSDEVLQDILVTAAKCRIAKWNEYRDSMIATLRTLYLLRLADRELELNLKWLSADKCLSLKSDVIELDECEYIKRLLCKNARSQQLTSYETCVERWGAKVTGDHRLYIHGHDFVKLLVWSIANTKGLKAFATESAVTRLLVLLASPANGIAEAFG